MAVFIAEYLGVRTDGKHPIKLAEQGALCPFMNATCSKIKEKNKPICSVRKKSGEAWIVCRHRLCATIKTVDLTIYQRNILHTIAQEIWGYDIRQEEVLIKREVRIPVVGKKAYNADYIMINNSSKKSNGPKNVVVEMQGGGETGNTGQITELIREWENNPTGGNQLLTTIVKSANTLETNAWRRQQEQFIIKGNISNMTNQGGIVFCVGKLLYDYLYQRVAGNSNIKDLKNQGWNLALICFDEDKTSELDHIDYKIDKDKSIFTNYNSFIQVLTNQGQPYPPMFKGEFEDLLGNKLQIE